jgi:hypothetical protein
MSDEYQDVVHRLFAKIGDRPWDMLDRYGIDYPWPAPR